MDGFFSALSASLVLLMLMSVGYFMGRLGWMTAAEKRFLSKFIVNIAVPCNCISGLLNNLDHDSLLQAGLMVASAMVGVAVTLALCLLLAKCSRLPRERWGGVFVAMAAFSNTLFIGLPVSHPALRGRVRPICDDVLLSQHPVRPVRRHPAHRALRHPGGKKDHRGRLLQGRLYRTPHSGGALHRAAAGAGPAAAGPIMTWAGYISQSVSPMALIYCGYIVFELGLKNLRPMRGLPAMILMRLGIAPVICWFFCHLFGMSGLPLSVFVVESALPVVSQVPVLAGAYGADDQYAATGASCPPCAALLSIPI